LAGVEREFLSFDSGTLLSHGLETQGQIGLSESYVFRGVSLIEHAPET